MNKPLRLLLMDGHRGVRQALRERLERLSPVADVVACENLAAAMEYMRECVPDVVLCDPVKVGGQGANAVRQLGSSGCPVVVLTSSLQEGEADDLQRAGAASVLLKGCSMIDLLGTLETVVAAHRGGRRGTDARAGEMIRR